MILSLFLKKQYLKVYFSEEFENKPSTKSLEFIINQHQLKKEEILIVGFKKEDEQFATGVINEVLSRVERLRAKARMMRTKAKREEKSDRSGSSR